MTIKEYKDYVDVTFSYLEKENILPGDVNYDIIYRVYNNANDFTIYFNAKTNKDTLVNLTNHTYFNLSGNGKRTILDHKLKLNCDRYTNLNNELITTSIDKVNKVMSFMKPHKIKKYINDDSLQNHTAKGYDHCYLKEDEFVEEIAILKDRKSKRSLTIKTSYPSIVVYTTNYPASFDFSLRAALANAVFFPSGVINIKILSIPGAIPPCGGHPYLNAVNIDLNLSSTSSLV